MHEEPLFRKGYIKGYWDGVKDAVSGRVADCQMSDITKIPIRSMGLSSRACNCLTIYGCINVGDIIALRSDNIMRMRNLGSKTAAEIAQWLIDHGILCTAWSEYV